MLCGPKQVVISKIWLGLCAANYGILGQYFLFSLSVLLIYLLTYKLIYNVVLASGVQQSDSALYIYILFQILFHYSLLQDIEYSSLCCTVGPCCLSILYIVVCIC